MNLIVGLGNPGARYVATRHNVGFMAVDALARTSTLASSPWKFNKKFNADIARSNDRELLFLKPQTFMNESGRAVSAAARFYKLPSAHIWILHDDLDLPFGSYKIQHNRGSAGHNGVESIFTHLNTRNFTRVRIGIAHNEARAQGVDFVLSPFTKEEQQALPQLTADIAQTILAQLHSRS